MAGSKWCLDVSALRVCGEGRPVCLGAYYKLGL